MSSPSHAQVIARTDHLTGDSYIVYIVLEIIYLGLIYLFFPETK